MMVTTTRLGPSRQWILWLAIGCLLGAMPASADRSENRARIAADNAALKAKMEDIIISHDVFMPASILIPGPAGTAAEVTAIGLNLGLKSLAPVFTPPVDFDSKPNGADGEHQALCRLYFNSGATEGEYEDLLGIATIKSLPSYWGTFGRPTVEHRNTGVKVYLDNLPDSGYFEEGVHGLRWRAETQISPFWDVALPAALLAYGTASEMRYGPSAAGKVGRKLPPQAASKLAKFKRYLVDVAADTAEEVGVTAGAIATDNSTTFLGDEETTVSRRELQQITVWDINPPFFSTPGGGEIEAQTVRIEATDFGGARFSRIRDDLIARFDRNDPCGRSLSLRQDAPSLLPIDPVGTAITWYIQDGGPYNHDDLGFTPAGNHELVGDRSLRTRLEQRVIVEDTTAPLMLVPPGFALETEEDLQIAGDGSVLGALAVIDRADPNPMVDRPAAGSLAAPTGETTAVRYLLNYSATDASGNTTVAPVDDPERYVQIVTLKQPNTNNAPAAQDVVATTRTEEPVRIRLQGADPDVFDGRADPLKFEIVTRPAHGEFVVPDLPFFLEDFRAQPTQTPTGQGPNDLACPATTELADGSVLEAKLGLLDVNDHLDYVTRCYCQDVDNPPQDFIYEPEYIHITDDDEYYVSDNPLICKFNPDNPAMPLAGQESGARLGRWKDGQLLAQRPNALGERIDNFSVDAIGNVWWSDPGSTDTRTAVFTLDRNFNEWWTPGLEVGEPVRDEALRIDPNNSSVQIRTQMVSAFADLDKQLLYVTDKRNLYVFDLFGEPERDALANLTSLDDDAPRLRDCSIIPVDGAERGGFTVLADQAGDIYVADSCDHRVHKYSTVMREDDGTLSGGAYVGWAGRCDANLNQFNHCNEALGRARGFTCTDTTCARGSTDTERAGDGQGQFDLVSHMALDQNDTLYVADFNNRRVQRFSSDGVFAGEAVSRGDGITEDGNFVIGNMGRPRHVTVNSESFHVLEARPQVGDYFLHIFKTAPFSEVTDSSAVVEYVSDLDFVGADGFEYLVDDGISVSPAAIVSLTVDRAFRAPESLTASCHDTPASTDPINCEFDEDTSIIVRLNAKDPDGFIGKGGNDELTYRIEQEVTQGTLTLLSSTTADATYRYTPNADYNGDDVFVFQANDGVEDAAVAGEATITVIPVIDEPVLDFADEEGRVLARGFEELFCIPFRDADQNSDELRTQRVDWGDGTLALPPAWSNIGIEDKDGNPVPPQNDTLPGEGFLLGAHTFDNAANPVTVAWQMEDDVDRPLLGHSYAVQEVTRVAVSDRDQEPVQPAVLTPLNLLVVNQVPSNWSGFVANQVTVEIEPPAGVEVRSVPSGCSSAEPILCDLGTMSQGEERVLSFTVVYDLATAREVGGFEFIARQRDAGPRLGDVSLSTLVVEVSDADDDGVIDVDDAYPDDSRYSIDTDGDGIADAWERDNRLDPLDASDAALDPDADGFDHLTEFRYNGAPYLGEAFLLGTSLRTDLGTEDRLGFALSSADVDGDGLDDVAMSAPALAGGGAVFVHLSTSAEDGFQRIDANGVTNFGRDVALGDVNADGFADLVVVSSNAAHVYLNVNGSLPTTPSLNLAFGNSVYSAKIADADNDEANDLLVGYTGSNANSAAGAIAVFRSADAWWQQPAPVPSKVFFGPNGASDVAIALGDLDGNTEQDLVMGLEGLGTARVIRSNNIEWGNPLPVTSGIDIVNPEGGGQFGFAVASGEDLDADGIDDLVIGAYTNRSRGSVFVYASFDSYLSVASPNPSQRLDGVNVGDQFGVRLDLLAPSGDKVGADLLIGANRTERGSEPDEGAFYLFADGELPLGDVVVTSGLTAHDMLGYQIDASIDLNGDGLADFVVSAPDIGVDGRLGDGGYVSLYYGGAARAQSDQDNDRIADVLDNCSAVANENQADLDTDGLGDACDSDRDGDGVNNDGDLCPDLADPEQINTDRDALGDACDEDDDNDGIADDQDAFPKDERYQSDSDGDGMADAFESANGLDPMVAADANQDADGDGRTNLDEFLQGGDVNRDDVPPVLTIPEDRSLSATGFRTPVNLGTAAAMDAKDGDIVPTASAEGPFASGEHLVTWRATDAAGNTSEAQQRVQIAPLVSIAGAQQVLSEGDIGQLHILLSGDAVTYPVIVELATSGSADPNTDYQLAATSIEIGPNNRTSVDISVLTDAIADSGEEALLQIEGATNAVISPNARQRLFIREGNVQPDLELIVEQAGQRSAAAYKSEGLTTLRIDVRDPNAGASHRYDWQATTTLVPQEGYDQATFTFDPNAVENGSHWISVAVTDTAEPTERQVLRQLLRIDSSAPILSQADSDNDGASDLSEGTADEDGDGVPAFQDNTLQSHRLPTLVGDTRAISVAPGLRLRLGAVASAAATSTASGAQVTEQAVIDFGAGDGPGLLAQDSQYLYGNGIYDFVISGLALPGQAANVIIGLENPVDGTSTYRKYLANFGWRDFVQDANNRVSSARGSAQSCPAPGSDQYQPGLNSGAWCVQLMLNDGGPNDADGVANRRIVDPGGPAVAAANASITLVPLVVSDSNVTRGQTDVSMLRFQLDSNAADFELRSLTLQASGSGADDQDVTAVKLWRESDNQLLAEGTYSTNDGVLTLQLTTPLLVPVGSSTYRVTYSF